MSQLSRRDYMALMRGRYRRAGRPRRLALLSETCEVCGYERKYAIKLLTGNVRGGPGRRGRKRGYDGIAEARVIVEVPRNRRDLFADDASRVRPGQWVALWAGDRRAVADAFMGSRPIEEEWTVIRDQGVPVREIHQVESVEGNRVRLRGPVKITLLESFQMSLRAFDPIEEVGVEDIAFMGNWLGHFVHHRTRLDDYHFNAVNFTRVVNGWVRRCSFINLNQTLALDTTANITVKHTRLGGTAAHSGPMQSRSTHNLVGLSSDESDGAWHNFQWITRRGLFFGECKCIR
jgi:hypothetical protein